MVHELTTTMASHHHRNMVKPILKKLHASPKNSLDLDRGWEDQTIDLGYGGPPTSPFETTATGRSSFNLSRSATRASARASGTATPTGTGISIVGLEPSMSMSMSSSPAAAAVVMGGGVGGGGGGATSAASGSVSRAGMNRSRYHHARSTSATSIATSNGSNHRPGASFVHPFQQTPRTNTPPLAYANSFTSFERDNNRDYSPTIITENDDDDDFSNDDFDFRASNPGGGGGYSSSLSQSLTSNHLLHKPPPDSQPPASLRRPSLASSLGDIRSHANASASAASLSGAHKHSSSTSSSTTQNPAPPLRINTNSSFARSVPTHRHKSSKLAHGSLNTSYSHSDLQLNQQSPTDSPRPSIHLTSPSTSQAPMSPSLRTSLEGAFRLRSRSEVDTGGGRREDIREARRKFEEAERVKQEKYEAEQRRKAERKAERRKNTNGSDMSVVGRPSFSRKRTPPSTTGSQARRVPSGDSAGRAGVVNEKADGPNFMSSNYASTEDGATPNLEPDVHDIRFETPRRSRTTRMKTQSYWTSFVLWLRTRLLKLGRR